MKSDKYVIDTFAWVEYFKGSPFGRNVLPYVESGNAITPMIVLAELSAYYTRTQLSLWEKNLQFVGTSTTLAEFSSDIAKAAGQTRQVMRRERPKFGLADAIIFETAKSLRASVVTGDPHFEGLPNTLFLKTT